MKDDLLVFIIRTKKKGSHTGLKGLGERGTHTNIRLLFQGGGGEGENRNDCPGLASSLA